MHLLLFPNFQKILLRTLRLTMGSESTATTPKDSSQGESVSIPVDSTKQEQPHMDGPTISPPDTTTTTTTTIDPLNVGDTCQVKWRNGERKLDAIVVERRPLGYRKKKRQRRLLQNSSSGCELEYYVHYQGHDRRLDEWIPLQKFVLDTLERQTTTTTTTTTTTGGSGTADSGLGGGSNHGSSEGGLTLTASTSGDVGDTEEADGSATNNTTNTSPSKDTTTAPATSSSTNAATTTSSTTAAPIQWGVGGNWHGNSGDPSLAAFEREHEETTKIKNIETIVMGEWQVEAWYYSPFPDEYSNLETLYVCEFCLTYMRQLRTYKRHVQTCGCPRHPPGRKIYSEPDLAVYELDGKDHTAYCQKLCLLAKLFLDHKTLYFDVTPFYFYVVTKVDEDGAHIVGYFSKEKVSSEGYNLACILTFPQYQKAGYGKFIISLSYELTKREGKTGSPEKPLSDLGKVSYRSYWKHVLFHLLARHDTTLSPTTNTMKDLSIADLSTRTGIKNEDILSTLQALDMIKVWKGQHVVYVEQKVLRKYMAQRYVYSSTGSR